MFDDNDANNYGIPSCAKQITIFLNFVTFWMLNEHIRLIKHSAGPF